MTQDNGTVFLKVIPQRHGFDCAVACLAMLLGTDYEETLLAFASLDPLRNGVQIRAIKAAATRLGQPLQLRRSVDLEHDTGLLSIRSKQWKTDHLVVLKEGLIIDTDSTIWDYDVYVRVYQAKAISLLVTID